MNRRTFFKDSSGAAAGAIIAGNMTRCTAAGESEISPYDLMQDVMRYRKFDAHCHPESDLAKQIELADRLGIGRMQISKPVTNFSGREPEGPEEVRRNNDIVLRAMKEFPGR